MTSDNIVKFPSNKVEFPDQETLNYLLCEKPLKGLILIVINEDDVMSSFIDGTSHLETIGMLEVVKSNTIARDQ